MPEDPSAQLLADGEAKYLLIDGVDCAYDRPAIERALADNIALSWRLHRDERGGRAFVAFSHPAAERTTLSIQHGSIGFDFNVDPGGDRDRPVRQHAPYLRLPLQGSARLCCPMF